MSILMKKIENEGLAAKARSQKINEGISHAAKVLHESSLGRRCPNLVKMFESENKDAIYQAATMVQLMENTADYVLNQDHIQLFTEADAYGANGSTAAVSLLSPGVASLTPRVVDIVNVFYPQMVANYIADIQALDRQSGQIFVIKTRYSESQGEGATRVEAGDIVFEKPTDGNYSSELMSWGAKPAAAKITLDPRQDLAADATVKIRAGSFIVRINGKEIARDYGNGAPNVNGVADENDKYGVFGRGVSGWIKPHDGSAEIELDTSIYAEAIAEGEMVSFEAAYDTETDVDLIRKIQFDIPNQPILAKEHPLMSSYSVGAGLVMNAHLAIDTDELIANQLAGTIRWERDLALIKLLSDSAKFDASLTFDCAGNGENLTLQQRYSSYSTVISSARGLIQQNAGRGTVEWMVVSATQGLPVVEQIEGFKAAPESKKPIGPYLAGTLRDGTISVIAVPYSATLPVDQVIFGFKGFQLGDSSVVLAEWVPLYFTPTFQAPNLKNHRGALSFYDLFLNKPEYMIKGAIANFNQQ